MKNKGLYWIKFASQASSQKHLGLTLDKRLTFGKHLKNVTNKIRQKKKKNRIVTEITEYLTKISTSYNQYINV